jgi:hypothetical protein
MKIPVYPKAYHSFITDTIQKAKDNNVKIRFSTKALVHSDPEDKTGSAGYFSSEPPELAVATKHDDPTDWLSLMVHESCHMDQYLDNRVTWDMGSMAYVHFFTWLTGENIYLPHEIEAAVDGVIDVELDCERRSVDKIKKYDLPINIEKYKRRANSYLYAIRFFGIHRKWYNKIYSDKNVWTIAPSNFKQSYDIIPQKLYREYQKFADKQ